MKTTVPHSSLARRLSLSVGLSSAVLSLVVLGLVAGLYIQRSTSHMEEHARRSAAFLAEALEFPLWNLDLDSVRTIGRAVGQDHVVGLVEVTGVHNESLFRYQSHDTIVITHRVQVVHDGQVIGWALVGLNDLERQTTLWPVVLTGAGLAGLIILLQYLLHTWYIRPLLGKPFASLDRLVTAYSAGDFSPALPQAPYAEFAPLFKLVGDMGGTIQQQMEDLKASGERLSLALDAANDGMWDWDVATGTTYFSPRYFTMLDYAPGEFAPVHETFQGLLHPGDRERADEALFAALGGQPYEIEFRLRDKSGQWRWVLSRGRVVERDDAGRPRRMVGTHVDITARKELELRLADQLAFQQALMDTLPYAVFYKGADTRFLGFNTAYEEMFGVRRQDLLGKRVLDLEYLPAADRVAYQAEDEAVIASGGRVQKEMPIPFADGRMHMTLYSVSGFRSADGSPGGLIGVIVDIAARKEAEAALAASEERFAKAFNSSPAPLLIAEIDTGRFIAVNDRWVEMLGYSREEQVGRTSFQVGIWVDTGDRKRAMDIVARDGVLKDFPVQFRTKAGDVRSTLWSVEIISLEGKDVLLSLIVDITERKQAEEALAASEEKYRAIYNTTPVGIFRTEYGGRVLDANPAMARMLGYADREEILASVRDLGADVYRSPGERERMLEALLQSPDGMSMEIGLKRKDGTPIYAIIKASLQFDAMGNPAHINGTIEDITERRRAEEMLRQSEEKFSQVFMLSPDNLALIEPDTGRFVEVNESFLRFHGLTREQAIGRTPEELGLFVDNAQREAMEALMQRQGWVENFEVNARYWDGSTRVGSISAQMMEIGGRPLMMAILRDITDYKKMQEVMVQTEKMISVGGIAAGVAHEINNPLGIVLQAAHNLIRRTSPDLPRNQEAARAVGLDLDLLRRYMQARKLDVFLEDIRSAAVRASAIIRHMLDFSRRSESTRRPCDLPDIVHKAIGLAQSDYDLKKSYDFRRILIDLVAEADLPQVICTETEIEQVILNLLRNAAQAMATADPAVAEPRIAIRLSGLPGAVRIEVEDNGPGIPPDIQRRIFEPFFTTKPPGEGTGLGLSVSYFIVTKGHEGKMRVESSPGKGTMFTIDLPTEART